MTSRCIAPNGIELRHVNAIRHPASPTPSLPPSTFPNPVPPTATMYTQTLLSLVAVASTALAAPHISPRADPKCKIVFDGRIPLNTAPTFFDTYSTNTIYNPDYVKGNDLAWSDNLKFPDEISRFDGTAYTALSKSRCPINPCFRNRTASGARGCSF